jgi:hypothetical protein
LAEPSVGELLTQPGSISEIDVLVSKSAHRQCLDILMSNYPKESALVRTLELNLTQWKLQSATTNVDRQQKTLSIVLVYTNGSQAVYKEHFTGHSFGCTMADPKYNGIMTAAQSAIDGLNYDSAPDFVSALPQRDLASFEAYSQAVCDPKYNNSRAFLIYQKGKLVWEKYCTPGKDKDTKLTLKDFGGYSFATIWPMARNLEGKLDLDQLSHCPELKQLEKRARNMTARNLMSYRIGRPLEVPPAKATKPKNLYDTEKMLYVVADMANYAAVVPSSYGAGTVPLEWSRSHYTTPGSSVLLQRELRYTFPASSQGFSEYAAYPWTRVFSQLGARSFTMEADASGTFVGIHGLYANARDFLRLGVLIAQQGKWYGKQILPAEYTHRNLNSPFGTDQRFGEGWWSFKYGNDVPKLLYLVGGHGAIYIIPELEIVIFDAQNSHNAKRTNEKIFEHMQAFLKKQTAAWITTTTSTTTTPGSTSRTAATAITATLLPAVTSPVGAGISTSVAMSLATSVAPTTTVAIEDFLGFASRSSLKQWILFALMLVLDVAVQNA